MKKSASFPTYMATIKDVLYYLNQLNFTVKINDDDYEDLRCVKRILVGEVDEYNIKKLIQVLNLVDHLFVLITIGNLDVILDCTQTLGENIFYLIRFLHFVNKIEE